MKPEIEITRIFEANKSTVWKAITEKEWMKQWYFDLQEFKPEVGFFEEGWNHFLSQVLLRLLTKNI